LKGQEQINLEILNPKILIEDLAHKVLVGHNLVQVGLAHRQVSALPVAVLVLRDSVGKAVAAKVNSAKAILTTKALGLQGEVLVHQAVDLEEDSVEVLDHQAEALAAASVLQEVDSVADLVLLVVDLEDSRVDLVDRGDARVHKSV
jgi:hypothetical protein